MTPDITRSSSGCRFSRRTFFLSSALAGISSTRFSTTLALSGAPFADNPFQLGIASGDPLPDGVVLWTRLAPSPLTGGGMAPEPVEVRWQIATDEGMTKVVQQGTAIARPQWAHAVHVEVQGLEADRWYWYQFKAGAEVSPVGRTRTAPAAGSLSPFRFAFASCQKWEDGYYVAHRDIARQDIDLVVFLGDYIYEQGISDTGGARGVTVPFDVRLTPRTLDQYRLRYGLYKMDPDLQAVHALFPWVLTWDDHEVENDYGGDSPTPFYDKTAFLKRRAAAYQAFYEHQPLRRGAIPTGANMRLYRRLSFGNLITMNVLDTREYRSHQHLACSADERLANGGYCAPSLDPGRSILGVEQKQWLLDGLASSTARWNVLAQQVMMAQDDRQAGPGVMFGDKIGDRWDGYAYERDELLKTMAEMSKRQPLNPVVLTGDAHHNYVYNLKTDWNDFSNKSVVGAEFVGTSITSEGDKELKQDGAYTSRCHNTADNPHQLFFDNHRGYVTCTVTPDRWQADYRVLSSVGDPKATATTLASFVVENGHPGTHLESGCPS